jgi:glycosyltransferase involved in cell wall biosynthesis
VGQALAADDLARGVAAATLRRQVDAGYTWAGRVKDIVAMLAGGAEDPSQVDRVARKAARAAATVPPPGRLDDRVFPLGEFHSPDGAHYTVARAPHGVFVDVLACPEGGIDVRLHGPLVLDAAAVIGGRVFVELWADPDAPVALALEWPGAARGTSRTPWLRPGTIQSVAVPHGAERATFRLRATAVGRHYVRAVLVYRNRPGPPSQLPMPMLHTSPARILLMVPGYPSYDHLYDYAFVSSRVRAYRDRGVEVDVFVLDWGGRKRCREFEGTEVISGPAEAFDGLMETGSYRHLVIHTLRPAMWSAAKRWVGEIPTTLWIHGAEIQPWWRRESAIDSAEDRKREEAATSRKMAMWREVAALGAKAPTMVFVSDHFRTEVAEDLEKLGVPLDLTRSVIVHNPVDQTIFRYARKDPAQRTKILMIRSFANGKYGTDLALAAIQDLAGEPWFGELEFLVVGDGVLFERDTAPLAAYPNVTVSRRFLTHAEIAELQMGFGVMLMPTRWDSQGVSRDEAMASGMVPVTNAVAAVPEFLSDREGYLAGPDDAKGLADAIRDLYRHPDAFERKSAAAVDRVARQTSAAVITPAELALFGVAAVDQGRDETQ